MVRSSHFSRLKTAKSLRQKSKEGEVQHVALHITGLDEHGQGLAKGPNQETLKVPFVLPGERCTARGPLTGEPLELLDVQESVDQRRQPPCPEFGRCGGCQLQHIIYDEQLQFKRQRLWHGLSQLSNVQSRVKSKSKPKPKLGKKTVAKKIDRQVFPSDLASIDDISVLQSSELGYRRRARLGISPNGQLGFRKAASNDTLGIENCLILTEPLQNLMQALNSVLASFPELDWRSHLGHVELLDVEPSPLALLRVVKNIPSAALQNIKTVFEERHWRVAVQRHKDAGFEALIGSLDSSYTINTHPIAFEPGRFIQVNTELNQAMVRQAMQWLDLQGGEQVLDLFCGVGNFTLPLAEQAGKVLGIELSQDMVEMARNNARRLGIENVEFMAANLDLADGLLPDYEQLTVNRPDVVLLDPPRAGAAGFIPTLLELSPQRILYISCHQGSLLRDLRRLGHASYRLEKLSLMDMFPNTEHVECMALLSKG
ncbi:23S rRNA (uracil(1939)-C(5))-methyltransferase RlmD [Pseudoteredinibacter isoporae]|uniref:23S rRNA (Uracil1939-C5)-methyltransferase n=1 Tax=Pseudoteredinibacter isoporae TaxID=570281 RepID=A0A7X0JWU6_9GAMM|nr:23S rRNA (uracil(1939)-C(5))-methyltransferase RlmD [Pseudoteredinibacter isoporae]MBB6523719.1 23S rRNA (uracil1939-C5)-methyltransferase [Pseudoteredinibacter isoporae]NHO89222.1 23S rRNA (uracil(1939)-C(5))-methyltransferase RlmD [Pseudoteredinibacter isoporae]NIB22167.1 23S rRNA (uracil(1939)-C(5))-methyltransferase RlmD [Pseudoteredinibacter isoporae]